MADGHVGMNLTRVWTADERLTEGDGFSPGITVRHYNGNQYMFVEANGAIAADGLATVSNGVATADVAGTYTAQAALADGEYGFVLTPEAATDPTPDGVVSDGTVTPVA